MGNDTSWLQKYLYFSLILEISLCENDIAKLDKWNWGGPEVVHCYYAKLYFSEILVVKYR